MADDSTQKWLGRNRPPRVQITYDLESGDAIQKKELPLVVGILADLAGENKSSEPLADLKKRKFIEIDRDNFSDVMKSIAPKITVGGTEFTFAKIEDFRPEAIAKKKVKDKLDIRTALNDLLSKLDGNDTLNLKLTDVITTEKTQLALSGAIK
jgi:type VI secretion system protein ImpB